MNARVGIALMIIVVVVAAALALRPSAPVATTSAVTKPPELSQAGLAAAKKASEASTKISNAVQTNAAKVAPDAQPVFESSSFFSESKELILVYTVNFDPIKNGGSTDKFAGVLAKNWKIKELAGYNPSKVTILFYGTKERIKATRSFDPSGKAL